MHETPDDIASLQELLDRSAAGAGSHLLSILTPVRRTTAPQGCSTLTGMSLLALATVTSDGHPLVGPVDGIFYRGAFYFGSSPESVRFRHIRQRPYVSLPTCRARNLPSPFTAAPCLLMSEAPSKPASAKLCSRCTYLGTALSGRPSSTRGRSMLASRLTGCSPSTAAARREPLLACF